MVDLNTEFCFYGMWSLDNFVIDGIKQSDEFRTLKEHFNYQDIFIQLYSGCCQEESESPINHVLALRLPKIPTLSVEQINRLESYNVIRSCELCGAFDVVESITPKGIDEYGGLKSLHDLNVKMDEFYKYCTDSVGDDNVRKEVIPISKLGDFICHLLNDK